MVIKVRQKIIVHYICWKKISSIYRQEVVYKIQKIRDELNVNYKL